jgi:ankyrin repeat protein
LSYAAENGHDGVVKLLLDTGNVGVDSKDKRGRTLLSYATMNGHKAIIELLLEVYVEIGDANRISVGEGAQKRLISCNYVL